MSSLGVAGAVALVIAIGAMVGLAALDFLEYGTGAANAVGQPSTSTTASSSGATQTSSSGGSADSGGTVSVSMPSGVGSSQSLSFEPEVIHVVVGVNNTVVWTNADTVPHTVTSTSVPNGAQKFNSGNMNASAVFQYTFTVPGNYTYTCIYHFWMRGTVVVMA